MALAFTMILVGFLAALLGVWREPKQWPRTDIYLFGGLLLMAAGIDMAFPQ